MKYKKVLIIDGHPDPESFSAAIATELKKKSQDQSESTTLLSLRDLEFDPILRNGYRVIQNLEPDLVKAQELLKESDHIIVITPIWWGGPTALLKGFLDRVMLPGFAFKYRKNSAWWDKYLTKKTGHLIVTGDAPAWWLRWLRGDSTVKMLVASTLNFVGIAPVRVTRLGNIRWLNRQQLEKILQKIQP
jgi:putative NADPH-quinone reductase